jgi:hypothetical protein
MSISKVTQPIEPTFWFVYQSNTGVGNPDTNPAGWSLVDPTTAVVDAGAAWFGTTTSVFSETFAIGRYSVGGIFSDWSVVST